MRKLLFVTDHQYVSAIMFHGYGLPPWFDLPVIQHNPAYRRYMTEHVNTLSLPIRRAGYEQIEVHEAFPVDLMRLDAGVSVLRGLDHFKFERSYEGVALLAYEFKGLPQQPRRKLLKKMTLNNLPLNETQILAILFAAHGLPIVYMDKPLDRRLGLKGTAGILNSQGWPVAAKLPWKRGRINQVTMTFDAAVPLKNVRYYPGITKATPPKITAKVKSADELLTLYRFAGMVIQASHRY